MATSKENLNRIYSDGTTILTAYLSQIIFFDKKVLRVLLEKGANPNQKMPKIVKNFINICAVGQRKNRAQFGFALFWYFNRHSIA